MKPIVILVHGMGTHDKGNIEKEFIEGVNGTAKCLVNDTFDIADYVDFKEFHYSDMLDEIRQKLAENATAIKDQGYGVLSGLGVVEEVITKLTDFHAGFDDDAMFATHWLDVILYGTNTYGEAIRVEFAKFLTEVLLEANGREVHVICHSLGTAVVHDALAKLYRKGFNSEDNIPDLPTGSFNLDSLWTFANVSRMVNLLNRLEDPMTSTVTTGPNGCVNNFYNIRHKLDPFTWFKTYNRKMKRFKTYENDIVRNIDTHDFTEYVADPLVNKRLINVLTTIIISNEADDEANLVLCMEKHDEGTVNEAYIKLKVLFDQYKDKDKKYNTFIEIYDVLNKIYASIDKLKRDL